ncbi:putative virion structural protein [Erwinia phage pEa_SNUABM_8]|nr:putative virion structural protein [Erwinia phage pEa_SNUABM_8]QVW54925.1 hypothetical protein pEaSNUABM4_00172 [Erwinia phage pEa_SNUABM_4]
MSIVLSWKPQPGQTLDAVEIYRYAAPRGTVNPNSPGTPLAILPGNATTYEDTTVTANTTYQYRIMSVKGSDKVMGFPIIQADFTYTGPGPQKLIRGDWWCGYFGTLPNTDFILNFSELNGLIGFSAWNNSPLIYHKFVFKGRILFIPDTCTRNGTTWEDQYRQGLMWGTDDVGNSPYGMSQNVNQRKTVAKNGFEYVVRLPRLGDYNQVHNVNMGSFNFYSEGEWLNTFGRLVRYNGALKRFSDYDLRAGTNYPDVTATWFANGYNSQLPWFYRASTPESPTYTNQNVSGVAFHVLELVLN